MRTAWLLSALLALGPFHTGRPGPSVGGSSGELFTNTTSLGLLGANDAISLPTGPMAEFDVAPNTREVTFAYWAKKTDNAEVLMFGHRSSADAACCQYIFDTGAAPGVGFNFYAGSGTPAVGATGPTGVWNLFVGKVANEAGTYKYRVSKNGAAFGTAVNAGSTISSTALPWLIGGRWTAGPVVDSSFNFNGYIDEFSVWNVALSDAEVLELWNNGEPSDLRLHSKSGQLKHWWRGDGDTLPTIRDWAGTAHGTALNNPTLSSDVPKQFLDCTSVTGCDMHFVADDWTAGTNWTSRDSNAWVATRVSSPVKQASTFFSGRSEITSFGANYFTLASNAAHTFHVGDKITYEWVFGNTGAARTLGYWGNYVVVGGLKIFNGPIVGQATGTALARIPNDTNSGAAFIQVASAAAVEASKPVILTLVVDLTAASERMTWYLNGVANGTSTSTTGTLASPVNQVVGLGVSADGGGSFSGTLMEVARHRQALSASTVAARAARFNALKGY